MNKNYANGEIAKFINNYPGFSITKEDDEFIEIIGDYSMIACRQYLTLQQDYKLRIKVPKVFPEVFPFVFEDSVIKNYPHTYTNGQLCLAVDMDAYLKLQNNPTLIGFFEEVVIPALYSYKFFCDFQMMPYGERSHGEEGVFEFYKEYFKTNDIVTAGKIMLYVIDNAAYRGHLPCPCGSGKIIRKCHGNVMLPLYKNRGKYAFSAILNKDFQKVVEYVKSKN